MLELTEIKESTRFYKPNFYQWQENNIHFFLDGSRPNWVATDARGAKIFDWITEEKTFGAILGAYARMYDLSFAQSWVHCHTFIQDALKHKMIALEPLETSVYRGRQHYLKLEQLEEFWIHLTQTCNLSCSHCLVSSDPSGEKGLSTDFYRRAIDASAELGVERYYFTGGEPFVRADIFDLIRTITEEKQKELIVLSNGTLFNAARLEQLSAFNRTKLKFQISLDGVCAATNDAIRGAGVFQKTSDGLKALSALGFEVSLTAVVTKDNLHELKNLPQLAQKLGAKSVHLMWPHKRGRILETTPDAFPSEEELLSLALAVKTQAQDCGILFDNLESLKIRANAQPGVKHDLGLMAWKSLCLYMDGKIYPSAAMAGEARLSLGDLKEQTLREIWQNSPLAKKIRAASVIDKKNLLEDPFKFLTGGGDMEHSYFFSAGESAGNFLAADPYYNLYTTLIRTVLQDLAESKKRMTNAQTEYSAPTILHAMGEDSITCSEDAMGWLTAGQLPEVRLLHSNCVLSFDVDKPYKAVQKFYGKAAEKPQEELCCPIKYDDAEISHIPQEVIDRFYGCGSPIAMAQIQRGETTLDLGSGAGIDCFIAAKKVGANGAVIGIDMTDQMLEVANRCRPIVAQNLGYDVVQFKKGYLEKIPVPDASVDLVTSNCVVNLSPNKKKVFAEIWRILKDTGRLVVADIVSERAVPLSLQAHQELWGECISGSLSEAEFMTQLEKSGFYGIALLKKVFWKEVEGIKFYSITVRAYKLQKSLNRKEVGQKAVYLGPYKAIMTEEGQFFARGVATLIAADTATKLKAQPYAAQFKVLESSEDNFQFSADASAQNTEISPDCCQPESCCDTKSATKTESCCQ